MNVGEEDLVVEEGEEEEVKTEGDDDFEHLHWRKIEMSRVGKREKDIINEMQWCFCHLAARQEEEEEEEELQQQQLGRSHSSSSSSATKSGVLKD